MFTCVFSSDEYHGDMYAGGRYSCWRVIRMFEGDTYVGGRYVCWREQFVLRGDVYAVEERHLC